MIPMVDFLHGNRVDKSNASTHVTTPGRERATVEDVLEEKNKGRVSTYTSKQLRREILMTKTTNGNCCS